MGYRWNLMEPTKEDTYMTNRTLTIKEYTEVDVSQMQDITVVYCRLSNDDGNAGDSNSIIN